MIVYKENLGTNDIGSRLSKKMGMELTNLYYWHIKLNGNFDVGVKN